MGQIVVNQGVTEERVRSVFQELISQSMQEYTAEATRITDERIEKLGNVVIPRIIGMDKAVTSLSDPSFQLLLKRAQISAATSDRTEDFSLLSELIACRVEKGKNRIVRTGITKAVEIVGEIDYASLCGLTVVNAIRLYSPSSPSIRVGLDTLNSLYEKLLYEELPTGKEWLDHLDTLGAIRISSSGRMKSIKEFYTKYLDGYTCVGIKKHSDEHEKTLKILDGLGLNKGVLLENELLEGYVRLGIPQKNKISDLIIENSTGDRAINENEIKGLEEILTLYSQDDRLKRIVEDEFVKMWDSFEALRKMRLWFEQITTVFDITKVGEILAHSNAKRCDSSLPDQI